MNEIVKYSEILTFSLYRFCCENHALIYAVIQLQHSHNIMRARTLQMLMRRVSSLRYDHIY
jgi:hypothetical protein